MKSLQRAGLTAGALLLYGGVVVLTLIFAAQNTRHSLLPDQKTRAVWYALLATLGGVLVLRSGWWRDAEWRREQARIGTLANNFYEPRREVLTQGFAVAGGLFGALYWGASTWLLILNGIRRRAPGRGLLDFEAAVVVGIIFGAVLGAVLGLLLGEAWERWHRGRRRLRPSTN
jgi:hypothetical protein